MRPKSTFGCVIAACLVAAPQAFANGDVRQFYISKSDQMLRVYENGELMEEFRISTGKAGHETPSGIFSVIHKRKYHESNLYSNAPMPFMQRLTWSGIALHEGTVPKSPASHGCIRIPKTWAQHLYNLAAPGTAVITTEAPLAPQIISHPLLAGQKRQLPPLNVATLDLRRGNTGAALEEPPIDPLTTQSIKKLNAEVSATVESTTKPLKLLVTWRDQKDKIRWAQKQLTSLGFDAGKADGIIGNQTIEALDAFKRWKSINTRADITSDTIQTALAKSGFAGELTNGVMRIRQDFRELTEFNVEISKPTQELGTHFLQAIDVPADGNASRWTAISLPNQLSEATRSRLGLKSPPSPSVTAQPLLKDTLERLSLQQDARDFLEANFSTHMSLSITDYSHDVETGEGTEFITVTKDS